jgi:hypothetical protein
MYYLGHRDRSCSHQSNNHDQVAAQCGLISLRAEFERRHWTSFRRFAFSTSYNPAQASDAAFVAGVVDALQVPHDSPMVGGLRSLFFESYTIAAHALRARLERTDDDPPVKLPNAERESRRKALVSRLDGLTGLDDDLDISHALQDRVVQIWTDNQLRYIPLSACTTRSQETLGTKKAADYKDYVADLGGERKIYRALQRRSLALEFAGLVKYEVSMKVIDEYFRLFDLPPPSSAYDSVSLEQIYLADQELWVEIARLARAGIRMDDGGVKPVEMHMPTVFASQRVQLHLTPLQRTHRLPPAASPPGVTAKVEPKPPGTGKSAQKRLKRSLALAESEKRARTDRDSAAARIANAFAAPKDEPGRGKGAGKADGKRVANLPPTMRAACVGKIDRDGRMTSICFGCNLEGCPKAKWGASCDKGFHGCAKMKSNGAACGGAHKFSDCTS